MQYPEYPFDSHFIEIDGHKMHYLDEGPEDAPVLVMLHGNPTWSFYYRKLVSALKDHYRCIVPDHIGMGLSDKPAEHDYDFLFTRRVDDLSHLLETLIPDRSITLIMHDWGGMIGMTWAMQHADAVKRLVIFNTGAFHLPKDRKLPLSLRLGRVRGLNRLLNQGMNLFCRGAIRYCTARPPMEPAIASAYLAPYNNWHNRLAVRKFVEDIPLKQTDRGFETITRVETALEQFRNLPALICWGTQDFVFDASFLHEWMRYLPDAELHQFEQAGHFVLEDAADEIIPLVQRFLQAHS